MKYKTLKQWTATLAIISTLMAAIALRAQTLTNLVPNRVISWNLDDWSTVNPGDVAGLAPATNWVDTYLNNVTTALPDNTGAATTMNLGYGSYNTYQVYSYHVGYDANGTANREMLNGFLNAGPASWNPPVTNTFISLTNVPYAHYDVLIYLNSDTSGRHASIDNGSTTYHFSTMGSAAVSGTNAVFVPTTQTNSTIFPQADFAFFPGMTNANATFTEEPKSGNDQWLGIAGFQVIESSNTYIVYGPAPSSQTIPIGGAASFKVMAGGLNPAYQWRHDGTNIDHATNATYSISSAQAGQDGNYDVIVSNSFNSVTSVVATLTFYTQKTIAWDGNGATWDTSSLFWTTDGGATTTNYMDTDNVQFGPLGVGQPSVSLAQNVSPGSITVSNGYYTFTGGGISGSGALHLTDHGTLVLDTADARTGSTLIDNGAILQLDNGDTAGSLGAGALTNNGGLLFDVGGDEAYGYPIYGSGSITNVGTAGTVTLGNAIQANYVVQSGGGNLLLQGSNTFSGGLIIPNGTIMARSAGALGNAPVMLNGGTLQLIFGIAYKSPLITLAGGFLHGGIGGDNSYDGTVALTMDSEIDVDPSDTFTLMDPAGISAAGYNLYVGGGGTLILAGTNNIWSSLNITLGTVQIGNGGSGSLGSGYVDDEGGLAFNVAGTLIVSNQIYGAGGLVQNGAGAVFINGDASGLTGASTISAGALGGTGILGGPLTVLPGGILAPGTPSTIGTMTLYNNLNLGGNVAVKVNTSLAQSNDLVSVSGTVTCTNTGTLSVSNLGPALKPGDKFTLFSQPVAGGANLTISGGGVTWSNNLANDGSIIVLSTVAAYPTNITYSVSNGALSLSWPASHLGWILQYQTNSLSNGLSTNWVDVSGSASVTSTNIPINPDVPAVFYRLRSPN